jgi:hypothetical protein
MGGAIFNEAGTVTITNSTITGNTTSGGAGGTGFFYATNNVVLKKRHDFTAASGAGLGGGLFNHNGFITVTNSTISGNTADQGRGIFESGDPFSSWKQPQPTNATAFLSNTIIGQSDINPSVSDLLVLAAAGTAQVWGPGDLIGTLLVPSSIGVTNTLVNPLLNTDPRLGPLQNNGGLTPTMALAAGSPAIDHGIEWLAPPTDQRGFSRNGNVDIGAFEFSVPLQQPQTITFGPLANRTYGDIDFPLSATGGASGVPVTFASSNNAIASVSQGAGGVWFVHINKAGSVTITASQAGNASYAPAPAVTQGLTIAKAHATVYVAGYTGEYDAAFHGATGSQSGVGGESAGTLNLGATFKDVPGGTAHWVFTGNGNYLDQSGDVPIVITRTSAHITVHGYTGEYDGAFHGATGSASGVAGASAGTLNLGATFKDVPGGTAHWTFTGNGNYKDDSGNVPIVITKATAHITVNGYSGVYDGAFHGATGSASGVAGASAGTLSLGATFKDVPGGTAHWTFTGNGNYKNQSGDVPIVITKAHATVNVAGYTGVYDAAFHHATGYQSGVGGESAGTLDLGAAFKDVPGGMAHWAFTGNGNYLDQSGDVPIIITRKALTGIAKTHDALNIARNSMLAFTIDVNEAGIVTARTVAQLYNGLLFTLSVGGSVYSVRASATVVHGRVQVSFAMTAELKAFLAAHTTATRASNAPTVGLTLSAISSDGNYTLETTALTRLYNSR